MSPDCGSSFQNFLITAILPAWIERLGLACVCYTPARALESSIARPIELSAMPTQSYREFESVVLQPGVRLCALESRKYKTVRANIILLEPLTQANATANSLLGYMLRAGTESLPSRRDIARAGEELFGASVSVGTTRYGDIHTISGRAEFPADRFLPKGANELQRVLELLAEMLTRPALDPTGTSLREETLAQEKFQLEHDLRGIIDEKPQFAMIEAQKRIYRGSPGAIYEGGRLEDISAVTGKSLLERHKSLLSNAQVMAFVTGPVAPANALEALSKALILPKTKRPALPAPFKLDARAELLREKLKQTVEQAHVVFAWSGAPLYGEPEFAAASVADAIFGGISVSRLFKVVREEHGLAYSVSSHLSGARGSMIGHAAVDPGKVDAAVKLVHSELTRLVKDGFEESEFEAARQSLIEARSSQLDSLGARVADTVFQSVMGFVRKPETEIEAIKKVEPAEVRAVLKKLKPHTEFRLAP